jgi:hypothetical protein
MSGLPKHFEFMSSTAAEGLGLEVANSAQHASSLTNGLNGLAKFPKRPNFSVLSEAIPLFYIALNNHGLWVAREAEGRCGGVFLLRRSAVRFAQQKTAPDGCALMFLDDPCELDVTNEGGRIVEPLTAVIDIARRRAPTFTAFIMTAIAQWRKLDSQILQFCAGERKNRAVPAWICSRYAQSSKNEDDPSFAVKRQAIWENSYDET